MNEFIEKIKALLSGKYQYEKTTMFSCFTAEEYPAICFEPVGLRLDDDTVGGDIINETDEIRLVYVEKAPKDRIMTSFINNSIEVAKVLKKKNLMINQKTIVRYKNRESQDNMEFIAEIVIQGETL